MSIPRVALQVFGPRKMPLMPILRRLLRLLQIIRGAWTITLVRDPEMIALHARTMGIPTTTDVLTFDLREAPRRGKTKPKLRTQNSELRTQNSELRTSPPLDLDTVISLDVARRRARELHHPLGHELLLYCLHSLLHVQGYDDTTPAESERMHAREDQILIALGIGPVYAKPKTPQNRKSKFEDRKSRRVP